MSTLIIIELFGVWFLAFAVGWGMGFQLQAFVRVLHSVT